MGHSRRGEAGLGHWVKGEVDRVGDWGSVPDETGRREMPTKRPQQSFT